MKTLEKQNPSMSGNSSSQWSIAVDGGDFYKIPLYPDGNAIYWYYAITIAEHQKVGLRIKGKFNHARYMGLSVYNDLTGNTIGSIKDSDLQPDAYSKNPFLLGVKRNSGKRDYTLEVLPEGYTSNSDNCIFYDPSLKYISIFLRVYLPDQSYADTPDADAGGVPLPVIEAFDPDNGQPENLETRTIPMMLDSDEDQSTTVFPPSATRVLNFFNVSPSGLYGNEDNHYLSCAIDDPSGKVALVRMKAPTHSHTIFTNGELLTQPMVRYWSFNICGNALGLTSACLADYQAKVSEDGFMYLLVGGPRLEKMAIQMGINYLPWGIHDSYSIIMRHLAANNYFPYAASRVPLYTEDNTAPAQQFIGDYAPVGILMQVQKFIQGKEKLSAYFDL